ncbi:MAG: hypothetical protein K1000chlam1_01523 [Candidatus Anoxychlamydiales bacterium]|nr:hypothetical protein [Candidatus Anoxychlamydiales bacterium]
MDSTITLNAPVANKDPSNGGDVYGKYGADNGVPLYLLGMAMSKEILIEATMMQAFNDIINKLNTALTKTSAELKEIMKSTLLWTTLTSVFSTAVILVSIMGVGVMLVDPVENPVTWKEQFQNKIAQYNSKADMMSAIFANVPLAVFSYAKGLYQSRSILKDKVIDLLKTTIDTVFTSYDISAKTLDTVMNAIQEMVRNNYKSSTLPLYYKNLQ